LALSVVTEARYWKYPPRRSQPEKLAYKIDRVANRTLERIEELEKVKGSRDELQQRYILQLICESTDEDKCGTIPRPSACNSTAHTDEKINEAITNLKERHSDRKYNKKLGQARRRSVRRVTKLYRSILVRMARKDDQTDLREHCKCAYLAHLKIDVCPGKPLPPVIACEEGWLSNPYNNICYKYFDDTTNYEFAVQDCIGKGAELAKPKSSPENDFLVKMIEHDTTIGSVSEWDGIWLHADDQDEEGNFVWDDGEKITFNMWKTGEPNDHGSGEDCNTMRKDGYWNDIPCGHENQWRRICQKSPSHECDRLEDTCDKFCEYGFVINARGCPQCECKDEPSQCGDDWVLNADNAGCYRFFNKHTTYDQAVKSCTDYGAKLAVSKSETENDFLQDLISGATWTKSEWEGIWLHATDRDSEGSWRWDDGNQFEYRKWHAGEPNDASSNEDCHTMRYDGQWNDMPCNHETYLRHVCVKPAVCEDVKCKIHCANGYVVDSRGCDTCECRHCEKKWFEQGDSGDCYRFFNELKNYDDSVSKCNDIGAELVVSRSEVENVFLQNLIRDNAQWGTKSQWEGIWLWGDDRDSEGNFVWRDDEGGAYGYKKWHENEPNDHGTSEDCHTMRFDGQWNDMSCNDNKHLKYVCVKKGNKLDMLRL